MAAKTISKGNVNESALISKLFAKANHVYFVKDKEITMSSLEEGFAWDMALPVIEESVQFNSGDVDKSEVNILDGTVLTSKTTKGDSDISAQIPSLDDKIASLFMKKSATTKEGVTIEGVEGTFSARGYSLEVKKSNGALIFADDTESFYIILTNVEMYGGLVVADGDNPAYFNVRITPKSNVDGESIILLEKD